MVRLVLLVLAGFAVGGSLGFLGGGGTILTVPVLLLAGASAKEAIAISLAVVAASAAVAVAAHAAAGSVDWRAAALFGPPAALGGFAGGRAAGLVEGELLLLGFTALMVAVGVGMLRPRAGGGAGSGVAREEPVYAADGIAVLLVALWMLARSPWVRGLAAFSGGGGGAPAASHP